MRIDSIGIYYIKNKLIAPWETAYGEDADIYTVLTEMTSGEYSSWSESSPLHAPTYSPEYAYGVFHLVSEVFAPLLIHKNIESAQELLDLLSPFKGNPFAKSCLEIAWWTLQAKIRCKPLHELLGGEYREIAVGMSFGIHDDLQELVSKVGKAVSEGYQRVKLKVKQGYDIDVIKTVRERFPDLCFHIDCNSSYSPEDIDLFREIDNMGLSMIEQPFYYNDIIDHARLQSEIKTPVCLDESCSSVYMASKAIEIGSCKYMNIKPGRVGGLLNSLKIHNICMEAGIGCWVGGMLETSVGAGVLVELATLPNMVYPADIPFSGLFYEEELCGKKLIQSSLGNLKPSDVPGIPYEPNPEILKKRTINYKKIN